MDGIYIYPIPLPLTIKGMAIQDKEGDYNIYINEHHSYHTQIKALQHELDHIHKNDFQKHLHIRDIEK